MKHAIHFMVLCLVGIIAVGCKTNEPEPPSEEQAFLFSVAANRKVAFAPGNLQYCPAQKAWRFAPQQYDTNTFSCVDLTDDTDEWVDLFFWGTGSDPVTPDTANLYKSSDNFGANRIGDYAANTWRTPSVQEWKYVLLQRPDAASLIGQGKVNGLCGTILLPDNWQLPEGLSFTGGVAGGMNDYEIHYRTLNEYTEEEWAKMEKAGAVFLQLKGCISYMGVVPQYEGQDKNGMYWSSTKTKISQQNPCLWPLSIQLYRKQAAVGVLYNVPTHYKMSVRLVRTVTE